MAYRQPLSLPSGIEATEAYIRPSDISIDVGHRRCQVRCPAWLNEAISKMDRNKIDCTGTIDCKVHHIELTQNELDAIVAVVYAALNRTEKYKEATVVLETNQAPVELPDQAK